ncbi:MAG: GNAT family N-acetyltransferase [Acidobacteriota bacterium]|nr:GNAT family N-acetyltransferase [Acidobacteriota bacterium]
MEIRLLTERDAEALWNLRMLALETDPWSFEQSPDELRKLSPAEYLQQLRANRAESFIVGAIEHQDAVGMVGFYQELPRKRRHKGWIWGVFVAPIVRSRGIARSLLQAAIQRAKTIPDVEILQLAVSINQPAPRHLYESLGFRPIGVEPAGLKIGNERLDEEHMVLEFDK